MNSAFRRDIRYVDVNQMHTKNYSSTRLEGTPSATQDGFAIDSAEDPSHLNPEHCKQVAVVNFNQAG